MQKASLPNHRLLFAVVVVVVQLRGTITSNRACRNVESQRCDDTSRNDGQVRMVGGRGTGQHERRSRTGATIGRLVAHTSTSSIGIEKRHLDSTMGSRELRC